MGYVVQGDIDISVLFDDEEYPLERFNVLNFLHIAQNSQFRLPTLHFSLIDQSQILKRRNILKDACKITIVIKAKGKEEEKAYRFRMFSYRPQQNASGDIYDIDGYLDSIPMWLTRQNVGYRGTTSNVISQIASQSGLMPKVEETNDSQLWLPQNRTNANFIHYLVKRGWQNETSFMQSVVLWNKELRYINVNRQRPAQHNLVYGEAKPNYIPVLDYTPSAVSGINNSTLGYKVSLYESNSQGPSNVANQLSFTPDTASPLYNRDVSQSLGRGVQKYLPINFGNVNSNYSRALYQNERYASLYNYSQQLLVNIPTEIEVFDIVNFNAEMTEGKTDQASTGNYIVTGKVIYVEGSRYYEKIIGHRHGTNL